MDTSLGFHVVIGDVGFLFWPLMSGHLTDVCKTSIIQPLPFQFTPILMIINVLIQIKLKDPTSRAHDKIKRQKIL